VGFGGAAFVGVRKALWWIPSWIGGFGEDGHWLTMRDVIAALISLIVGFGIPLALAKLAVHNAAEQRREESRAKKRAQADLEE